ncbi:MAG TPA: hypothetical protein VLH94_04360 [Spirochaetia bacterium]|nr:hypothetical protein [Spirochaetia bacterium]
MKAKNAKPGQFLEYKNGEINGSGVVCIVKNGLCLLNTGLVIPDDQEIELIFEYKSFYISYEVYEKLYQYECNDFSHLPSGEKMLFIEIPINIQVKNLPAFIKPIFFDSRMQVLWTDRGEMISRKKYIAIDLETVDDEFAMTLEGLKIIEKYYPQDI